MTAVDVFVDTVRCYDGACGAVAAPEPWFVGLLAVCLAVLWQAARATSALVSVRPVTAAGTQLMGRGYGIALTAVLFAGWTAVAFGISVPALGAVRDPFAWTAMVTLHATLLLAVPLLVAGYAVFAASALPHPDRFRPESWRLRAAVAAAAVALPAGHYLAGSGAREPVAGPASPGGPADALAGGPPSAPIEGLWWLADRLASPAGLAVAAAAAACYVLLPRTAVPAAEAAQARQPVAVVSSGSFRRGGGGAVRAARAARAPSVPPTAGGGPGAPTASAVRASTLAVGAVLAVAGGAAVTAGLVALLAAMPGSGPLLLLAVPAGCLALGLAVRAR